MYTIPLHIFLKSFVKQNDSGKVKERTGQINKEQRGAHDLKASTSLSDIFAVFFVFQVIIFLLFFLYCVNLKGMNMNSLKQSNVCYGNLIFQQVQSL